MPDLNPIFITGPTAVGKSAVALRLAQLVEGEIISVDSMQVYRGLDFGTAKPSRAERAQVPHHLIDVAELDEPFDASQFVHRARRAVEEIQSRGHVPIFCGGTGLYFKAYLEGIGDAPPSDAALRAQLECRPLGELLAELDQADPALSRKIDRANRRRIVRAVEVIRLTGRPFSEQRAEWSDMKRASSAGTTAASERRILLVGLQRAPEDLRDRIDRRVEPMFEQGLVAETERLLRRGLQRNRTAMQAIGYRQVVEHILGQRSLPDTIALVKQKTRQFARRQMTWFRHQANVEWIAMARTESDEATARTILHKVTNCR